MQVCLKHVNSTTCEYKTSNANLYTAQIAEGLSNCLKIQMTNAM